MRKRDFPNLRLLSAGTKGYYFGAFESADDDAKKGYDFFISNTEGVKDWCECMGFVHGKMCYHIREAKQRFSNRGDKA